MTWNCSDDADPANHLADCDGDARWHMGGVLGSPPWVTGPTASVRVSQQTAGMIVLDVTADGASFLAGTAPNHGWLVRRPVTVLGSLSFGAREHLVPPQLVLEFVPQGGEVPPVAPDTIPGAVYDEANLVTASARLSGTFVRNVVVALFAPEATPENRTAAVGSVSGTVVGGTRLPDGDGFYVIRVPDDGTEDPLFDAIATLEGLSYMEWAGPEVVLAGRGKRYDL